MFTGFDFYRVETQDILLFLRFCKEEKIILYKLKKIDIDTYQFYTAILDRYKMKKNGFVLVKSVGVLHYFLLMFSNVLNVVGLLSFVVAFFICNQLILEVEIYGNNPSVNTLIEEVLKNNDIHQFKSKCSYEQLNLLYDEMKNSFKQDIDYLNVYQSGSVFKVEYTNSVGADEVEIDFRNIYACKDGFIKWVDVKSGNILVSENMFVQKGQELVSNTIVSSSDEVKMIPVEGEVFAYTYECYEASISNEFIDEGEAFSYLLFEIRSTIEKVSKIDKENVVSYNLVDNEFVLEVQYIFIEQIGIKGD